jgi:DNA-binding NtrC family response regulator
MMTTEQPFDGTCTVLIVDDEVGPRESLRMVLSPDFRVLSASGGEEALAILRRERVDVVTLDLRMPGLDGTETLKKIREIDPDVNVVILTAFGSKETVMDTIYLGAFSYINKPFHAGEIRETIQQACELRRKAYDRSAPA